MGHTQESFSRELGISLPTLGNWEALGRLPLDIMLARLADIAREAGHVDLEGIFRSGLEELKLDRAQKANDIFDEIERWHAINAHIEALGGIDAAVRGAATLDEAKAAAEPMYALLVEFKKTLIAVQKWSWRNR
jgi:transcriptional regulator with XRE-family HTH domain